MIVADLIRMLEQFPQSVPVTFYDEESGAFMEISHLSFYKNGVMDHTQGVFRDENPKRGTEERPHTPFVGLHT